jgi:hypothetical protein
MHGTPVNFNLFIMPDIFFYFHEFLIFVSKYNDPSIIRSLIFWAFIFFNRD